MKLSEKFALATFGSLVIGSLSFGIYNIVTDLSKTPAEHKAEWVASLPVLNPETKLPDIVSANKPFGVRIITKRGTAKEWWCEGKTGVIEVYEPRINQGLHGSYQLNCS